MIPQRLVRVAGLIKKEISNIIQRDLHDPNLGFITVTKTTVTRDLKQSDIWISVMGDEDSKKRTMEMLNESKQHIWELLASRVKLKYLPAIRFHLDTTIEYSIHINDIITRLRKEEHWED